MAKFLVQAETKPQVGAVAVVVSADDKDAAEAIVLAHLSRTTTLPIDFVHTVREATTDDTADGWSLEL